MAKGTRAEIEKILTDLINDVLDYPHKYRKGDSINEQKVKEIAALISETSGLPTGTHGGFNKSSGILPTNF